MILISNPQSGDYRVNAPSLKSNFIDKFKSIHGIIIGYIIHSRTSFNDIRSFVTEYASNRVALIHYHSLSDADMLNDYLRDVKNDIYHVFIEDHTGRGYQKSVDVGNKILIRDGLNAQDKNSDYPENEYFSDLHATYSVSGFDGFGDFSIVGDQYKETGGPAYAVAIHLSYKHKSGDIWIRHFISDRTDTPVDPAGKFFEALTKFQQHFENDPDIYRGDAFHELLDLYRRQHYPGLGYVKKLAMEHHIELIANQILQ